MKIKTIQLHEEGLNRFFGPLESRIMSILWNSESLTIKDVQSILNAENPISFNAVMTVMNRLLEKGHLIKSTRGKGRTRITVFKPVQTKEQFLNEQTKVVTHGLIHEFGDIVVNHMIDALEDADPDLIAKLSDKLEHLKSRTKP
jgi:predicted transcriptional regulator